MTTVSRILAALDEPTIKIVRLAGLDGSYHNGVVRIDKHPTRPYERVLLHELLHHLYPSKSETWVLRYEARIWGKLQRHHLNKLTEAVKMARKK